MKHLPELATSIRALRLEDGYVSEEEYQRLLARHLRLIVKMKKKHGTSPSRLSDVAPLRRPTAILRSLN